MKILCIIDSLGSGGAQMQMTYLVRGLKARGHAVELFLYHPGQDHFRQEVEDAGVPIHKVLHDGQKGFSWLTLWQLRRRIAKGFDAIISFQMAANLYSVLARFISPLVRLIVCERTSYIDRLSIARQVAQKLTWLFSDFIVPNSETEGRHIRGLYGLSKKVFVIWNGYEIKKLPVQSKRREVPSLDRLLIIGRISYEKNGLRILQGLDMFLARHGWMPEVYWAGRRDDDPTSRDMQRKMDQFLTNNPEISRHWSWLGEVIDVQNLYIKSDALILPSLFEGLPNVVCEAMIAGCPVIASNVHDHPLLLGEDEERGLLCDPYSPESICEAIGRMSAMSIQERSEITQRARVFAEKYLDLDRMVKSYERLLVCSIPGSKS